MLADAQTLATQADKAPSREEIAPGHLVEISAPPTPFRMGERFWAQVCSVSGGTIVATVHTELVNLEDSPVGKLIAFQVANVCDIGVSQQTQATSAQSLGPDKFRRRPFRLPANS